MTQTGGGGIGNQWINISAGPGRLGPAGDRHQPDPRQPRGLRRDGPRRLPQPQHLSVASGPFAGPAQPWTNITGNLFQVMHNTLRRPGAGRGRGPRPDVDRRRLAVRHPRRHRRRHPPAALRRRPGGRLPLDWTTAPTWALFPNDSPSTARPAGTAACLPGGRRHATSTWRWATSTRRPAAPDGRSPATRISCWPRPSAAASFAIRLAPIVFANTPPQPNLLALAPADTGSSATDRITNDPTPTIIGLSQQSAFGNVVTITLFDLTDPANRRADRHGPDRRQRPLPRPGRPATGRRAPDHRRAGHRPVGDHGQHRHADLRHRHRATSPADPDTDTAGRRRRHSDDRPTSERTSRTRPRPTLDRVFDRHVPAAADGARRAVVTITTASRMAWWPARWSRSPGGRGRVQRDLNDRRRAGPRRRHQRDPALQDPGRLGRTVTSGAMVTALRQRHGGRHRDDRRDGGLPDRPGRPGREPGRRDPGRGEQHHHGAGDRGAARRHLRRRPDVAAPDRDPRHGAAGADQPPTCRWPTTPAFNADNVTGVTRRGSSTASTRPPACAQPAEPLALVQIFAQQVDAHGPADRPVLELVGEAVADAAGNYAVTVGKYVQPTPPVTIPNLADGNYPITALQVDVAGNTGQPRPSATPGTVIIDGTDANDHGFFDPHRGQPGGLVLHREGAEQHRPNVTNGNRVVLALGADPLADQRLRRPRRRRRRPGRRGDLPRLPAIQPAGPGLDPGLHRRRDHRPERRRPGRHRRVPRRPARHRPGVPARHGWGPGDG